MKEAVDGFATWNEAVTVARDRAGWRRQVNGPNLLEESYDHDENILTENWCTGR